MRHSKTFHIVTGWWLAGLIAIAVMPRPASGQVAPQVPKRARAESMRHLHVERPASMTYSLRSGLFYVAGESGNLARLATTTVFMDTVGTVDLPFEIPPRSHLAHDSFGRRLLIYDAQAHRLHAIPEAADGRLDPAAWTSVPLPALGPVQLTGIAVDPQTGETFLLDRLTRRIARVTLPPGDSPTKPNEITDPVWIVIDPSITGELGALVWHPDKRHFYVMTGNDMLYELSEQGQLLDAFDLAALPTSAPGDMVLAPSADRTDASSTMSLYLVDPGDPEAGTSGYLMEVQPEAQAIGPIAPQLASGELVRIIDTSQWSPPSPDPSGISYDPVNDRLLVVDGEVEEVSIWANVNLFECSRTGALLRGSNLTSFTIEPTGSAFDVSGRRMFITDDDARHLNVVQLGSNMQFDISDPVTWFSTRNFGSDDPEGVCYDEAGDRLFVADGVNNEIYEIHPGADGQFDGNDVLANQFDTGAAGVSDPETVEFDPETGTLYLVGGDVVAEVTTSGTLIRQITLGGHVSKPAGLTIAPNSVDPSGKSFYITDRAVDNDSDPSENDGKIFEFVFSNDGSPPGPPMQGGPDYRVLASSDDAEESSGGGMTLGSGDLDLEPGITAGMRFAGLSIPQGAAITTAYLQFTADESQSGISVMTIRGESAADAATFATSSGNITSRPPTSSWVEWNVPDWTQGDAGSAQRSPELRTIIQEIVSGSQWASGNAIVLTVTSTSKRTAESFDASPNTAAVLHIEFATGNAAPLVEAGDDQTIVLGNQAQLAGSVIDGSLPPGGALVIQWQQATGPATVGFGDASNPTTTASFPALGTYRLRLWATDGELEASDSMTVVVDEAPPPMSEIQVRVAASSDDAEERPSGVSLGSSDLELTTDATEVQIIGLRFPAVEIARGAVIQSAYVQFQVDEVSTGSVALTIRGQVGDAETFTASSLNVSSRPMTSTSVSWSPPDWNTVGAAGTEQRTPDLKTVVQEIVDRGDWSSGQGLGIIITGTGRRTAEAYDGDPSAAALLVVEIQIGDPVNQAPVVDAGPNQHVTLPGLVPLDGTVTDDGLPVGAPLITAWRMVSGPATPVFSDSLSVDTSVELPVAGTYVLSLDARDGEYVVVDQVTIVADANVAPVVNAGVDLEVTLPSAAQMDGSVSDATIPIGSTLISRWRASAGPSTPTIVDSTDLKTQVSFTVAGTYVLELFASDGDLEARDWVTVVVNEPPNAPPTVDAGPDQSIALGQVAALDGTVSDATIPAGSSLTTVWRPRSGPAIPVFADSNAVDTEASFSAIGTYVLELFASDGLLDASDTVTIEVSDVVIETRTISVRIDRGSDDAEERLSNNNAGINSSDLELVDDAGRSQVVGLVFRNVVIPPGAQVRAAYVQFQADEADLLDANLTVHGQRSGNAETFSQSQSADISSRPLTSASVPWSPPPWPSAGARTADQRTPDLATIIQEIIGLGDWAQGNQLAIIIDGSGERTAESYEGNASGAAELHVTFDVSGGPPPPSTNQAPVVEAGGNQTVTLAAGATLHGSVTDDGLPAGTLSPTWRLSSGPAVPTFDPPDALDAVVSFPMIGSYVLALDVSDGELVGSDSLTVTVEQAGTTSTTIEVRINAPNDDAEERSSISIDLSSSDLELTTDGTTVQVVGLRFANVTIPRGAVIETAYIQFQVDEVSTGTSELGIQGQTGDAVSFSTAANDVSSRPRTSTSVSWSPPDWNSVGAAGSEQQTPELKTVIQEIVSRSDWNSGQGLGIIITGTGRRTAESYDGSSDGAPLLHVVYR